MLLIPVPALLQISYCIIEPELSQKNVWKISRTTALHHVKSAFVLFIIFVLHVVRYKSWAILRPRLLKVSWLLPRNPARSATFVKLYSLVACTCNTVERLRSISNCPAIFS